jgi:osmotically inducible protein OsmC
MQAKAFSSWQGSWKEGSGDISTADRVVDQAPYTFASRFENAPGASPEQLLAAAHAGCFNQALANNFGMLALTAQRIDTSVAVDLGRDEQGRPTIKGVHIDVQASAPGISAEQFAHCAERARSNCSISKVLSCAITLSAVLLPPAP